MIDAQTAYLRPIKLDDAKDIYEYAIDPDTGPRAGWTPHKNMDETKELIKNWLMPESNEEQFVIVLKETGKVVGTMGLTDKTKHKSSSEYVNQLVENGKFVYEIGITIGKKYWGMGLGTKTIKAMINYLFEVRGVDVVITRHYAENLGSKTIQERNNLKEVGTYQSNKKWYNTDCFTMVVREKTREDWLKEKQELEK